MTQSCSTMYSLIFYPKNITEYNIICIHTCWCIYCHLFPSIFLHHNLDSISLPQSRQCNIKLTTREYRLWQVNSNIIESLSLRFIYWHGKSRPHRKLSSLQSEWHFFWIGWSDIQSWYDNYIIFGWSSGDLWFGPQINESLAWWWLVSCHWQGLINIIGHPTNSSRQCGRRPERFNLFKYSVGYVATWSWSNTVSAL